MLLSRDVGMRDPADPATHRLALHESGHATACIVLGRAFRVVDLAPDPRRDLDAAVLGVEPRDRPLGFVVTLLAGPLAEHVHAGVSLDEAFCSHGYSDTSEVLDRGLHPDALATLARRANRLVANTHAAAVVAVADALTRAPQRLSRHQVADLVRDHQPGGPDWRLRITTEQITEPRP